MDKNILIIYYTQSGQLHDIVNNLVMPFEDKYNLDFYKVEPQVDFPFPWNNDSFFDAFPESFQQIPVDIKPPSDEILNKKYDLVILAYQVWFLTPSIPINSFMKSAYSTQLLKNKNIVTVIGCRNMWAKAQQKMKALIDNVGGRLVGNLAFVDRHLNHISVITIVHWMMSGKKTRKFGIFPKPGVSIKDIKNARKFGEIILKADQNNTYVSLQKEFIKHNGVYLKPFIVLMDEKANKMFEAWSKFILKNQTKRKFKLKFFKAYLSTAIWLISPIVYIIFLLTYPFRIKQIRRKNMLYCDVK